MGLQYVKTMLFPFFFASLIRQVQHMPVFEVCSSSKHYTPGPHDKQCRSALVHKAGGRAALLLLVRQCQIWRELHDVVPLYRSGLLILRALCITISRIRTLDRKSCVILPGAGNQLVFGWCKWSHLWRVNLWDPWTTYTQCHVQASKHGLVYWLGSLLEGLDCIYSTMLVCGCATILGRLTYWCLMTHVAQSRVSSTMKVHRAIG